MEMSNDISESMSIMCGLDAVSTSIPNAAFTLVVLGVCNQGESEERCVSGSEDE